MPGGRNSGAVYNMYKVRNVFGFNVGKDFAAVRSFAFHLANIDPKTFTRSKPRAFSFSLSLPPFPLRGLLTTTTT